MISGCATDVRGVVAAEVERIQKAQSNGTGNDHNNDKLKDVLSTIQRATTGGYENTSIQNSPISISSNGTTTSNDIGQHILANIGLGSEGAEDGGGDGGDDSGGGNNETECQDASARTNGSKRNEFTLVNPRNITITPFSSRNLNTTPYIPFNNSIRRLTLAQGSDGELLLKILDGVEALGPTKFTNSDLHTMITRYPKIKEFDTAIKSALLNWPTGTANNIIRHNVNNGLDAWRKLYNSYVPLAQDLQNILICELMPLKPMAENDIDSPFNEVERVTDLYVNAGSDELSHKWIKDAILKNLPEKISTALAIELKKATSIDDMQNTINIYLHDHRTGLPRGTPGAMLYLTEAQPTDAPDQCHQATTLAATSTQATTNMAQSHAIAAQPATTIAPLHGTARACCPHAGKAPPQLNH